MLTPEDHRALEAVSRAAQHRNSSPTEPLLPWQEAFIEWYITQGRASRRHQLDAASALAGTTITYPDLMMLKRRKEWRDHMNTRRTALVDPIKRARQKILAMMPAAMDIHRRAMEEADHKKDYRAVPPLTQPLMDRAMPKHEERESQPVQVVINLSGPFAARHARQAFEDLPDVEALPLPPEDISPRDP